MSSLKLKLKNIMNVPGLLFKLVSSIDEFQSRTELIKNEALDVYDSIGKEQVVNFANVAQKLANFELKYLTEHNLLTLYQSVHKEKSWRDASMESDKILSDLDIELKMRKDVFDKFNDLKTNSSNLSPQENRYIDYKIKEGKHNGLHCSDEIRKQIEQITKELSKLQIDFSKNLSEEKEFLIYDLKDLDGCPQTLLEGLEKVSDEPDKVKVTLKYPHVFPLMKYAKCPESRKRMDFAFNSRCKAENDPLLKQMLVLRNRRAKLLGFDSHANYILSRRMAKNKDTVWNFLQELLNKLKPLKEKEMMKFLQYKEKLHKDNNWEFNGRVDAWDMRFYMNMLEKDEYSIDHELLKQYFPLDVVTRGMFHIYETLLGLKFNRIPDVEAWHEDVELYSVSDADESRLMGYFFLDLHPREGKYGHACITAIQVSGLDFDLHRNSETSQRQVGAVTMLANFSKPSSEGDPALLDHDEVTTYFHEFGHIMHGLCCHVDFAKLLSFNVEWDFVECPSQMLENWCWESEGVKLMSRHYKKSEGDADSGIEDALLARLQRSRLANVGVMNTRQVCLATFDQLIHTDDHPEEVEPSEVYNKVVRDYLGVEVQQGINMPATFGHMAGGYDAQYYGYLWSEVFAADMFMTRFKKAGIMDPTTGRAYRDTILRPGSSRDANDMLVEFLGRKPNQEAFLRIMGL